MYVNILLIQTKINDNVIFNHEIPQNNDKRVSLYQAII